MNTTITSWQMLNRPRHMQLIMILGLFLTLVVTGLWPSVAGAKDLDVCAHHKLTTLIQDKNYEEINAWVDTYALRPSIDPQWCSSCLNAKHGGFDLNPIVIYKASTRAKQTCSGGGVPIEVVDQQIHQPWVFRHHVTSGEHSGDYVAIGMSQTAEGRRNSDDAFIALLSFRQSDGVYELVGAKVFSEKLQHFQQAFFLPTSGFVYKHFFQRCADGDVCREENDEYDLTQYDFASSELGSSDNVCKIFQEFNEDSIDQLIGPAAAMERQTCADK